MGFVLFSNLDEFKDSVKNGLTDKFKIKVIPSSRVDSIEFCEDFIKIKIKEKAIEGKANKAIIIFLSDILKIAKSKIKIENGEHSSIKTIQVFI